MARKHRRPEPPPPSEPGISSRGWKVIGAGVLAAAAGYVLLAFTDARGTNWQSSVSPFLILGGYALMGVGIVTPDPGEAAPEAAPQ